MWTLPSPWQACTVAADVHWAGFGSTAGIETRRRQRLAALMAAARRSPLYRERFARHGDAFEQQPPITKAELMARFDDWVCDPRITLAGVQAFLADARRIGTPFAGDHTVWESSGSSGVPGIFVQDAAAMAVYDALEALRRPRPWNPWAEAFGEPPRTAFVGATGGHFASTVSVERLRRLVPGLAGRLRGFSFLQPTADLVRALNRWQPSVVATYPTAALLLAEEQAAGRLRLRLRELCTGGEALGDALRGAIATRFGCPVHASYGASEFLALAAECPRRRLHLNADWVLLEAVDAHGRPVPPGTTGARTLLSNLANHVQPLIRYELGDRLRFDAAPCPCGLPLPVIEVQGRVDDALLLHDRHGRSVRLLPLALSTVLEDEAGVFSFQLLQRGPRTLQLCVGGDAAALARARAALQAYLRQQGLDGLRLQAACGPPAVRGRSGKLPRVVRCGPLSPGVRPPDLAQDQPRGAPTRA
ncbi:MAG TPA: AMP-binding protein [Methylibium sp.]|nr:AMP-binding protein [Methylibium sp.]